jgi:hypothetical protein
MLNLRDIQYIFNRALSLTFAKKKLALISAILGLCGLLVIFCRALAVYAGQWIAMSLVFMPFFLCSGILLSTGIFLIRIYHDEVKRKKAPYKEIFTRSWEIIVGASYFSIPIILSYLLLWMMLGIFVLLKEIPGVGDFFTVILAFGPFLLNLGTLVLCVVSISMLYFIAPIIALRGINRIKTTQILAERLQGDVFSNILLGFIAIFPLLFCFGLLSLAAVLTGSVCYSCEEPWHHVLQWFFIMIPFTVLLTPAVIFFFNFCAEAHVLIMKNLMK